MAAKDAIDEVADDARIEKRLGHGSQPRTGQAEDALSLPEKEAQREDAKRRERPDMPLEKPPSTAPVLDVGKIEEPRNDGNRRRALQAGGGEFLDDRIDDGEVRRDDERNQGALHFAPRSISLWHSMHVRTNGWFSRRGLRMSWPQTVQTP